MAQQDDQPEDMVCSQEILCTIDFITPVEQQFAVDFNGANKDIVMPVGLTPLRSKRPRNVGDDCITDLTDNTNVLLGRQRVMSPPCLRNPFLRGPDDFTGRGKQGCTAFSSSRYHEEFYQIQEIGKGNFSRVFKVVKRLDGCYYAVKRSNRPLLQDGERRRALREVQALACLGHHDNVVRYFSSWFENDLLYVQMELCDCSLRDEQHKQLAGSVGGGGGLGEKLLLEAMSQLLNALKHLHLHGVVHLDLKPDNIYVLDNGKGGAIYKIGDFGSASFSDGSMSVEEGDARYLPMELINDDHSQLEKADMFSLGATLYELARGSALTSSGSQFQAIRQGKLSLLPGCSLAFQSLIRSFMHPDPRERPTAAEALANPLFRRRTKSAAALRK